MVSIHWSLCKLKAVFTNFLKDPVFLEGLTIYFCPSFFFINLYVLKNSEKKSVTHSDLYVISWEVLRWHDYLVQITLHQLCYEVDLLEKINVWGLKTKIFLVKHSSKLSLGWPQLLSIKLLFWINTWNT